MPGSTTNPTEAAAALLAGNLVALPTETVYGLGGFARSAGAIRRIFTIKGRPPTHPVIVHVAGPEDIDAWAKDVPQSARILADAFWPGPLTIVVPRADTVDLALTGGQSTIALRAPAHPMFQDVLAGLAAAGEHAPGIAAPSANRFGRVSPTTAEHVIAELGDLLGADDMILDGGPASVGVESTIALCGPSGVRIARAGGVSVEQLSEFVDIVTTDEGEPDRRSVRVPGGLESHYAPTARVTLVSNSAELETVRQAHLLGSDVGVIGLAHDLALCPPNWMRLAQPLTSDEYAHELYASLRRADELGLTHVIALAPPPAGIGAAITDRLKRAST